MSKTGIVRYDPLSSTLPNSTRWFDLDITCTDESYDKLHPVAEWQVGPAANGKSHGERANVAPNETGSTVNFSLAALEINPVTYTEWTPFQIDYSDPMFLHLNQTGGGIKTLLSLRRIKVLRTGWVYFPAATIHRDVVV